VPSLVGFKPKRINLFPSRLGKSTTLGIYTVMAAFLDRAGYKSGVATNHRSMVPMLNDMATWTELIGHAQLRSFVDDEGHFWLEQNSTKQSKWAKLAREGHDVAWEFAGRGGSYTGRMLVDGELYTPSEATKKFLQTGKK
jgi:hypothetical protein